MRALITVVLIISTGLLVGYARNNRASNEAVAAEDRPGKLDAVKSKFKSDLDDLVTRFQKAETPAEKKGIQTEAKELAVITAGKVLKVAEENPKDDVTLDAIQFTYFNLIPIGAGGADIDKIVAIATEHHVSNPKMKDVILVAQQLGSAGEKLVQAAAEKSTDKEIKAISLYTLGMLTSEKSIETANEKAAIELTAKAIEYLERAAKESPDLKLGEQTIAELTREEITALKTLSIGNTAPDLEGTTFDGKKVKLSSYKGKVVLLDVWATWCGPCVAMIPHERAMVAKLKGKPFELVSISVDDEKEQVTKFLEKQPMPWTHWFDGPEGPVSSKLRVKAFPTLYLIDAKGVIRKKWIGVPGNDPESTVVEEAVEQLLKEIGKG
jgi:thiol-disulfide isomerase/thioredoxin